MSNIFKGTDVCYFQIPQAIIRRSMLKEMTGSALKLYVAVLYEAQRYSNPNITLTSREAERTTGLSANSVSSARTALVDGGYLKAAVSSRGCEYIICDPETAQPVLRTKSLTVEETTAMPRKSKSIGDLA